MKRTWVEKCKQIEQLASHYKRHPLNSPYRPRLAKPWQPSSVWRLFHRQAAALQLAKTCKEVQAYPTFKYTWGPEHDVHIFALETVLDDVGRRLYLVTTYTEFWFYYNKNSQTLAHCYEVIPADTVCKLYFDLEFFKPANPGADGQKMVALLIELFIRKLQEHYGLTCSADCVLNLDSSTDEKFSRHLIFLLPNAAFKDNIHVGNFIKTVLQPLLPQSNSKCTHTDPGPSVMEAAELCEDAVKSCKTCNGSMNMTEEYYELSYCLVRDKSGRRQPFIDLGVYTKNRNFRLYKSSKLGKNAVLELAEDNKFSCRPPKHLSAEEHIFLCSLISNVRFTDSLKILSCASPSDRNESGGVSSGGSLISGSVMNGYQSSPYPEIDQFILSLVTREGFHGGIRQWNYFALEELLVYDTTNYRWCENIGRAHKSNNVMLLVDLKRDVWYQKCHDPICRAQNFKSDCYPLPPEVCLPSIFKEEDEDWGLTMDENGNIKKTQQLDIGANEHLPGDSEEQTGTCKRDLDDCMDDACMLEAAEDAELADIADHSVAEWNSGHADIPDELLLEAINDQDTSVET